MNGNLKMDKKIDVAVIGIGHLGSWHAKDYASLDKCRLVGVCDIHEERAKKTAKDYNCARYFDYRELAGKAEAVSIAVPTGLHHEIAKYFLSRGIHVLVEKPMVKTLKDADELIAIANEKHLILQVGHIERFNSAVMALADVVHDPRFIECDRLGPFTKRGTDIGVILDLMIHDIDIILSFVKSRVKEIQAVGINVLSDYEDIANVRLVFQNGTICNLTASRIANKQMRKIRMFQKDSYVSLDYIKQKVMIYKKSADRIVFRNLKIKKELPLRKELASFIGCVIEKKQPVMSGIEGRQALEVALEIQKKIKENA